MSDSSGPVTTPRSGSSGECSGVRPNYYEGRHKSPEHGGNQKEGGVSNVKPEGRTQGRGKRITTTGLVRSERGVV